MAIVITVSLSEAVVEQTSRPPDFDVKKFLRPLLVGLPEEDLNLLAQTSTVRTVPRGTVIVHEGERGDVVYVVYKGRIDIHKRIDEETERLLHTGGPGEFFGEIAVLRDGRRTATVHAATETTVLEIGKKPFIKVLGRSPTLAVRFLKHVTQRLRDSDEQAIHELQRANLELRTALRRLERLDQRKSDFIQVSAHELRTPLAALLGYTQMMENSPAVRDNPELRRLMDGILASTKRLHRVFNSILDASRVMNDELKVYRSPVSVPAIFHTILSEVDYVLEERQLTVEVSGLQGLPFLSAAPDLLTKAFQYLLNNAIKYTPDGGQITITVEATETPELGPCVQVAIKDTGIGIAPEDLDLIFDKFYRTGEVALHSSGTTSFKGGGPGLGLTIAKGVVEAHNGRIWAESPGYDEEKCPGSTFYVQLPVNPHAAAEEATEGASAD